MKIINSILILLFLVILNSTIYSQSSPQPTNDFPTSLSINDMNKPTVLPFRSMLNLLYVHGKINNKDSCWFNLDTGFPYTLLNGDRLDKTIFNLGDGQMDNQPGGQVEIKSAFDISIDVGGINIKADSIRTFPLCSIEPIVGQRFDGIIGHDLFEHFIVTIDYINETIKIEHPDTFNYTGDGTEIELALIDNEPFLFAEIKHPDGTWRKAKLKIDTGSADFIGFNGSYIQAEQLVPESQKKIPVTGAAVGGETENWLTRIAKFRVQDIEIDNPIVGYSVDTTRGGDAGTIGAEFLSRFTVIFDYPHNRMFLVPNKNLNRDFSVDMSGIFPIAELPDFTNKKVLAVEPHTPAADAGILPGDVIVTINNIDCSNMSIAQIREQFKRPGKVQIEILHESKKQKIELLLKPLL